MNNKKIEFRGTFCNQPISFDNIERVKSYFTLRPALSSSEEIFNRKLNEATEPEKIIEILKGYWAGVFRVHIVETIEKDKTKEYIKRLRRAYGKINDAPHLAEDTLIYMYIGAIDDALNGVKGAKKALRGLCEEAEAEAERKLN